MCQSRRSACNFLSVQIDLKYPLICTSGYHKWTAKKVCNPLMNWLTSSSSNASSSSMDTMNLNGKFTVCFNKFLVISFLHEVLLQLSSFKSKRIFKENNMDFVELFFAKQNFLICPCIISHHAFHLITLFRVSSECCAKGMNSFSINHPNILFYSSHQWYGSSEQTE